MASLPSRLFRVDALVGYGWPELREQIAEHRTFATAQQAADWCEALAQLPSHHKVVSVNRTDVEWIAVREDELPPARRVVRQYAVSDETCVKCDLPIAPGAAIVGMFDGDQLTAIAHADCPVVEP